MKLLITSLVIFALCCGLPGCINARNLDNDNKTLEERKDKECHPIESYVQQSYLLFVGFQNISMYKCSKGYTTFSNIKIHDISSFSEEYNHNYDFTYNCANNNMYILKTKETREAERVLEVLHYNENHEFERVNEVPNMFDRAISISSDWRTGNIYWLSIIDGLYSSIKVTDKSFNKSEYVIHPTKHLIHKIQVYPKRKEIFFSNSSHLFYTSTSPNSTAKLLFSSSAQLDWVEDFAIDYATDKLCWVVDEFGDSLLNCIGIGSSERPLKARNIVEVKKIKGYMKSFAAFDYTFYWTRFKNEHELNLYEQVGNRSHIDSFSIPARNRLYLLPSNCPYNKEDEEEYEEDYEEDYEDSN